MRSSLFGILFCSLALTVGCDNKKDASPAPAPVAAPAATCTAGYVQHLTYGCIPQSNCQVGHGYYNSQCIPLNVGQQVGNCQAGYVFNNNQCIPQGGGYGGNASCQGMCPSGLVQTGYGCLPQYMCQACFGYTSGYCVNPQGQYYYLGF